MAPDPERPPEKMSDLVAWAQTQLVTTTCGLCGASVEAPASEARAWFAAHRATAHRDAPVPEPRRRRTSRAA